MRIFDILYNPISVQPPHGSTPPLDSNLLRHSLRLWLINLCHGKSFIAPASETAALIVSISVCFGILIYACSDMSCMREIGFISRDSQRLD